MVCGTHPQSQDLGGRGTQISVSSRPAWSTQYIPGQPGLRREILSQWIGEKRDKLSFYSMARQGHAIVLERGWLGSELVRSL